jgi:diguanylate cyclase (GGDEF)-like protein
MGKTGETVKWLLLAFGLMVAMLGMGTARAQARAPVDISADIDTHALSRMAWVLKDPTRELSFEQVLEPAQQARFAPVAATATPTHFGLTQDAIWLRLDLRASPHTPAHVSANWLLEVGFPLLDEVTLYETGPDGLVQQTATGRTRPASARPLAHRHFVFPLTLPTADVRTVYLRITSDGTVSVPLHLYRPEALWRSDQISYGLLALYFGLVGGMFVYNLLLYASLREKQFLSYLLFTGSMAVGQLGLTGLGAQYLWAHDVEWSSWLPRTSLAAAAFFATRFVRHFLETPTHFPRFDRLLNAEAAVAVLTVFAVFAAPSHWSAWMLNALSSTLGLTMVYIGAVAWRGGHPGARYFLLAWFMLLVGAVALPLHNLGLLPINALTRNALMLGSALEMLLLSFALADRFNATRREKELAQTHAIASEQQRVEMLRHSEHELEQRVIERTLALELANQQLKDNEQRLTTQAFQDPLTALGNRALLHSRMSQAIERSRRHSQGFAVLLIDLDGFKAVNDHHGHAAGDALLVEMARRLNAAVRGVDTVARVGGDEFVVLLEDVNAPSDMATFEAKLAKSLGQPLVLDGGVRVGVTASIGGALFPEDGQDAEALLRVADHMMYERKNADRRAGQALSSLLF